MSKSIRPLVICGGAGTRLWPLSRNSLPKQFVPLLGEHSSFQETVLRVRGPYFVILTFGVAELVKYIVVARKSRPMPTLLLVARL